MQVDRRVHVAIAPVSNIQYPNAKAFAKMTRVEEIRLDVIQYCSLCGVAVRHNTAKMVGQLLCQGCRRSELKRQGSLEDIRPASPMGGKPKDLNLFRNDSRVHPSWTTKTQVESEPESLGVTTDHFQTNAIFRVKTTKNEDVGSFRSMEVLTCFRSQVRRGLRLVIKAATAEQWLMCWAILLSMLLLPMLLMLMVVAGVGFLVLSTWVTIAAVIVYPLTYINPRLYDYAMDS